MHNLRLTVITVCTLFLLVCSCNKREGAHSSVEEAPRALVINEADSSIVGTLDAIDGDNITIKKERSDERLTFDYSPARNSGRVIGDLRKGDRYALTTDASGQSAATILNITQLSGLWLFDKDGERGVTFTAAGSLSSVNPEKYSYRSWKPYNGRLILYYIDVETVTKNSRDYLSDTTDVVTLTDDNLVYLFRGDAISCHRQKEAIKVKFEF